MGGGKSSSWGGGGGGGSNPIATQDLISNRERLTTEVDQVLTVLKDVEKQYGINMDTEIGIFRSGDSTLGYFDPNNGNIGMNKAYFNSDSMDAVMDEQARIGYHPSRGNKSGIEAVMAHEAGHKLNYALEGRAGEKGNASIIAKSIVEDSAKQLGYKNSANMARKISKYATENYKEAIAEAFSDVYCNGKNAKKESRTIVDNLNKRLGG